MASTTALLTGLSGMNANARRLDVIGNNIANVNTTAFKSNRTLFSPTFSRTLSSGSGPSGVSGGTSPTQIGLGVSIAGTQRNFASGGISATGQASDLAIEGNGFFIVKRSDQSFYSRNGSFQLNATRELISASGDRVQGYGVDDNFNIVEGNLTGMTIPIGSLTIAGATQNVNLAGNLNAGGSVPTSASDVSFDQIFQDVGGVPLTGTDFLDTLEDPGNPLTTLFPTQSTFRLTGAKKGGKALPDSDLTIVPGTTTVQDLLNFINQSLGIVPGLPNPDTSAAPPFDFTGASIDGAGQIAIISNTGADNAITLDQTNILLFDNLGAAIVNPFTFTENATANGESVRTTFAVYDSLGSALDIDLTLALESKGSTGTTWRYYVDSEDNLVPGPPIMPVRSIATGTISFDNFGRLSTTAPATVQVGRAGTGAVDPLNIDLFFTSAGNKVTSLTNSNTTSDSTLAAVFQDGTPLGTLTNFSVGGDGVITGGFSNGLARTIGRVAIATFSKPEGLFDVGNDLFAVGPNSGTPLITTPGQFGAGKVIGGALEQSNVDLGQEFIELVLTSTGYSASSRVISTADQLLQQLISLGR